MATEWAGAVLTTGALMSTAAGVWVVWKLGPTAQRTRRKVAHERVAISATLGGRKKAEKAQSLLIAGGGALALYLVTTVMFHRTGLAVAMALGGFMLPVWIKEWQQTRRLVSLSEQLGRAMGMIGTSLRRGTPLEGAIAEAARTMPEPLGPVLRSMVDATSMGVTLAQAVEQCRTMPAASGSPDFQVFATEMVVCHERGANVVQAFEILRQVLEARRKYRSQVREHMGQHLMQSLVIASVGYFVLFAYSFMSPDGLSPLLESVLGQMLLAGSILGNLFLIRVTHLSMLRQTQKV
ncbi:MAG TPA: type II secretion system F family protein [Symbiobacteriaceae bacterium]|nr:type II secretion system F family protein [Symbiobacteriaceae bacterium]